MVNAEVAGGRESSCFGGVGEELALTKQDVLPDFEGQQLCLLRYVRWQNLNQLNPKSIASFDSQKPIKFLSSLKCSRLKW